MSSSGSRSSRDAAPAAPVALPSPPPGRPPELSLKMYMDDDWIDAAVQELANARNSVILATYMLNNPKICAAMEKFRRKNPAGTILIVVDRQNHEQKTCPGQLKALGALLAAKAQIYLCYGKSGKAGLGYMHVKCLVVDRKVAFFGGANCTKNAENSWEMVSRVTGPQVQEMVAYIVKLTEKKNTVLMSG